VNTEKSIEKAIEAIREGFGTCRQLEPGCASCEAAVAIYHLEQLLEFLKDE
jgi:hypothetical protein